ncbi:MAG: hypothetical protein RMI45_00525 [Ignisphaera sp.]|nr:hypothetical protein [Ignisphaera sp.]MDW8084710.1 hypothetical protein [Ignisphaera sp.]
METAISNHYLQLSKRSVEHSSQFEAIALDALRHAVVYTRIMGSLKLDVESGVGGCKFMDEHISRVRGVRYGDDLRKAVCC